MENNCFLQRLSSGDPIVVAEGYLLEFERRCYLNAGSWVPTVILDHPEKVTQLHEEFAHAGSDVVLAFQYFANKRKMKDINREADYEAINKKALSIAKAVAEKYGCLLAGDLCNSNEWDPDIPETVAAVTEMLREQMGWCVEAGVDYVVGESLWDYGEASLIVSVAKEFNLPCVITLCAHNMIDYGVTADGVPIPEALRKLEMEGAAVVGLNCNHGPVPMLALMKDIRKACKGPIAALPVNYRTTMETKCWYDVKNADTGEYCYPNDLPMIQNGKTDVVAFGKACQEIGIQYVGLCCGNSPSATRDLAITIGKTPPSAEYVCDHNQKSSLFAKDTKRTRYNTLIKDQCIGARSKNV